MCVSLMLFVSTDLGAYLNKILCPPPPKKKKKKKNAEATFRQILIQSSSHQQKQ